MARFAVAVVVALSLAALSACMPPAAPDEPQRVLDPGEFYWIRAECAAGAQLAVAPPGGIAAEAVGGSRSPAYTGVLDQRYEPRAYAEGQREQQQLEVLKRQYFDDCMRTRGYRWYGDQLQDLRERLR